MTAANVAHLKENGLNAIFAKLEAELDLQNAFKILWSTEKQCIRTDVEISAVYRSDMRVYSVDEEEPTTVELKVNLVSCARYVFKGVTTPRYIEDGDIVAQVYVNKSRDYKDLKIMSESDPFASVARLADFHLLDRSAGLPQLLCEYVRALYKEGFRIHQQSFDGKRFDLALLKEDVLVRVAFYVKDFLETRLFLAHKNDAYK